MAAGISDENAAAGMSAEVGGDWSHPGQNPMLTGWQKAFASGASFATGQVADSMSDFENFLKAGLNGSPPSIASTVGVFATLTPVGPEVRETSIVEKVIAETLAGKGNILSTFKLSADEAIEAGLSFLGVRDGYKELGVGVYRSNDGMRQFRIDNGSLTGAHRPGVPHVHLELFRSDGKQMVNNHIPFED